MAEVKAIAGDVKKAQQSEGKDLAQTMRDLAKKHGTDVITLNKVAKLVENPDRRPADPLTYGDYILPRGRVPFARPDMVKQLLALRGLTAPLKIDVEEVDKSAKSAAAEAAAGRAKSELEELNTLNKNLFSPDIVSNPFAKVGQIQVLTNKPRDVTTSPQSPISPSRAATATCSATSLRRRAKKACPSGSSIRSNRNSAKSCSS